MKYPRTLNEAFNDASRAEWVEYPTRAEKIEQRVNAFLHILCAVGLCVVLPLIYMGVL